VRPSARSDTELLAAHSAGDEHAFSELAARHLRVLWGVAAQTLRHPEDAADAVQEALVAAYRAAATFRGDSAVRTWLVRIVINACIDRVRADRVRVENTVDEPAGHEPVGRHPDLATDLATRLSVREALAMLPEPQRAAVVLVEIAGWPVAEAAGVLQVPVGTVKSRCARGRARLAVLLGHLREEVP
jgi:RNA polymerase sigma-70 factor (ECF subfamily)